MRSPLYWFSANRISEEFPDPRDALGQPDGLLAAGGDLSPQRLLEAYRKGIFPWYESNQPILWWSPDPRTVLLPERLKVSRSLRRTLKRDLLKVTVDRAFETVIRACAEPRKNQSGTWLTRGMIEAYERLHAEGHAHSVECWCEGKLVGGLYGVALGQVFFGESMFSRRDDASKVCLVSLVRRLAEWNYQMIDCQVHTEHLRRLGAIRIPRREFITLVTRLCVTPPLPEAWEACSATSPGPL